VSLVRHLYAAFQRGDIEAIVATCAPDVTIGLDGRPSDVPMFGHRNGATGVREFFRVLAETHEITEFEPQDFYADRDKVFVPGRYAWTMCRSRRPGDSEWFHIFTFRDGKLTAFRSLNDTALLTEAYRS